MQQRESIVSRFHDSTSRNNESRMFHKQKLLLWWCRLEEVNIVININLSKVNQEIKSNLLPFLKVNKLHLAIAIKFCIIMELRNRNLKLQFSSRSCDLGASILLESGPVKELRNIQQIHFNSFHFLSSFISSFFFWINCARCTKFYIFQLVTNYAKMKLYILFVELKLIWAEWFCIGSTNISIFRMFTTFSISCLTCYDYLFQRIL